MDEKEQCALGDYCESLMRADYFNQLCEAFRATAFNNFLVTRPDEASKREHSYADVWGLQKFLDSMKAHVIARDNIIKAADTEHKATEEAADDQPIDFD